MRFRRNKPRISGAVQIVGNLSSMLSKETLLQLLPFIDNPKEEIEKLDEEQEQDTEGFGVYQNFAKAQLQSRRRHRLRKGLIPGE